MRRLYFKSALATFLLGLTSTAIAQTFSGITGEQNHQNTPSGWPSVALPQLPEITSDNTYTITDSNFGATADSTVDNTAAIQSAIDAAAANGGGMVVIPAGTWLFGSNSQNIVMKSKTILHLAAGAKLKLAPYGDASNEKKNFITCSSGATDIVIEGEDKNTSILEGQGARWWLARENGEAFHPGAFIRFPKGRRYLIRNLKIQNSPGVNITISQSGKASDATIHDIIIREPASEAGKGKASHNTDGIAMWGPRINIYNCDISNGDDNVVADSESQYIHVWDCVFGYGHGASVGSYTHNVKHLIYDNISFTNTTSGVRLKTGVNSNGSLRGGGEEDFTFSNMTMTNVRYPFSMDCFYDKNYTTPENDKANARVYNADSTPSYKNILLKNIVAKGSTDYAIFLYGRPESHIKNVTLDNVQIEASKGINVQFVDSLRFINGSKITPGNGVMWTSNYDVTVFDECGATELSETGDVTEDGSWTISSDTQTSSSKGEAAYENDITVTNEKGKSYDKVSDFNGLKYSAMQSTITFPEDKEIVQIDFYGRNNTDEVAYIGEVNGVEYDENTYTFPADKSVYKTYSISFSQPVSSPLTFTIKKKQTVLAITLHYKNKVSDGISMTKTGGNSGSAMVVYDMTGKKVGNMQNELVQKLAPGYYISKGRKFVVCR